MPRIDLDRNHRVFKEQDFFYHADDGQLKELTNGAFPAQVKTTHPVLDP